jgi:hypothetical protein
MNSHRTSEVSAALRRWFVVHFAVDLAFAVPLFVAPELTLELFGWSRVDPVSARMVAAALFAIGTESLLMRGGTIDQFRTMLSLKCLWSGAALLGLTLSLARGAPPLTWPLLLTFALFAVVWNYYRLALRPSRPSSIQGHSTST